LRGGNRYNPHADRPFKTAAELREARAEIERVRSDADLHLKTAAAELHEARAEIEHL
jgi:hypothetical protein